MTVPEIMTYLQANGSESIKKILVKHGIKEPFFGVKVEYLKTIQKQVKKDYQLAKDLYATGNADAMYLAGLIADDEQMSKADLQTWAKQAVSNNISEYTVPWVATGGKHGFELALEWIDSPVDYIAAAGWSTLGNWVSLKSDSELDIPALKNLMQRVIENIHSSPNRVKVTMNNFIICVGSYVTALNQDALDAAKKIGAVTVDMNGTACKTPDAGAYINKAVDKGTLGKKKKMVKC
ncbi:DNA alkylation repair protein [Mucilaginibacter sp. BJC16-A38]|uniref:DNA alkylation repair protein n=1 Tax=Mucilaginibacter phenanthrenivorans TaxID=1234842 RepID=UPI002157DA25|nr:DNA alkylation repair protein [Mucilaginibacter phenanthrenivorans]MCR8558181.1 DNA alkylation repair protein [Mucilaginibacter phenanthrenivorans]